MKKYIRVEDWVYAFVDFSITENMRCLNHYGYRNKSGCGILGTLKDFKEYKQADTIEELVDELVIHNPSNDGDFYPKHFVYKNKWETMLKPISDYQKSKGIEVYGAIWTDKGLIYVAKFNSYGELELL